MRSLKIIIPALLISTLLPGCSRLRQMTRRDYASLEDPFTSRLTDEEAIAAQDAERRRNEATGQIRTASQTRDMGASANNRFAGATGMQNSATPGTGPSLSDFVEKADNKVAEARAAAAAFGSAAVDSAGTDMAGMTQFLGEQATASGLTDTAQQLDEDFAQWAATQKQEWASKGATVDEQASPFLNAASAARQAFNQSQTTSGENAFDRTIGGEFAEEEVATPFIQQASGTRFGDAANRATSAGFTQPSQPRIQARTSAEPPNPFDDLMRDGASTANRMANESIAGGTAAIDRMASGAIDAGRAAFGSAPSTIEPEWDVMPVAPHQPDAADPFISPGGRTTKPRSMDSNFSFDTGWKPSDVVPR